MFDDPYDGLPPEAALPSLDHCTARRMTEVPLVVPSQASSFRPGCMPLNALHADPSTAFWSKPTDPEPSWTAKIGERDSPVTLVVVHAAHPDAGHGPGLLTNIEVRLLNKAGDEVWVGPAMSVAKHDQADTSRLMFFVPAVSAFSVRVLRSQEGEPLGLRAVQVFVMPAGKYKLSRTILTIDKYAVPQPFSLTELATNTAYTNLFTSSACHELHTQESFVEEKVQDAVNLAHHLQAIWCPETQTFRHGQHIGTVRLILLGLIDAVKAMLASDPRPLVDIRGPCYVLGDIHGNYQDLQYFTTNLIAFRHIKYCAHSFVFLGDYVDRGPHDVECLAYLLSLKVQAPDKVVMLRGNHEDRRQNFHLKESFHNHCVQLFGEEGGLEVWNRANDLFEYFPVCGVINQKVFCCHGGIPQVPRDAAKHPMRIRDVLEKVTFPLRLEGDSADPYLQTCTDLLWSDPGKDLDYFKERSEGLLLCLRAGGCGGIPPNQRVRLHDAGTSVLLVWREHQQGWQGDHVVFEQQLLRQHVVCRVRSRGCRRQDPTPDEGALCCKEGAAAGAGGRGF
eukprot:TRINITY_DN32264_c0_g1_i2.p1 TRINITY_DN32264_c0_g1~~TRINITY_DN32264_c0_g1_i2.p1  ORF type:complete len:562 (+),score=105.61 TRINITY_DN32264_c0_g1_i2:111-1796(+)